MFNFQSASVISRTFNWGGNRDISWLKQGRWHWLLVIPPRRIPKECVRRLSRFPHRSYRGFAVGGNWDAGAHPRSSSVSFQNFCLMIMICIIWRGSGNFVTGQSLLRVVDREAREQEEIRALESSVGFDDLETRNVTFKRYMRYQEVRQRSLRCDQYDVPVYRPNTGRHFLALSSIGYSCCMKHWGLFPVKNENSSDHKTVWSQTEPWRAVLSHQQPTPQEVTSMNCYNVYTS